MFLALVSVDLRWQGGCSSRVSLYLGAGAGRLVNGCFPAN
jgi:hypothetical protein